ncbi:hypothetical protein BDY24DRAFT_328181, partial [Mrakia frigida]|uniref:GILT family protein n=1 Tax=Mrakia frigida TaxID=29902 RepID=UPI003FCBF224
DSQPIFVVIGSQSRCPDAFLVESLIGQVLADKRTKGKVELDMIYIGSLNSSSTYGVDCKHGELECIGNIQQLCTQSILEQDEWWSFLHCQNYYSSRIGEPSLAAQCAKVVGFTWPGSDVEKCVEGKLGKELLVKSVKEVKKWGVEKSATVMIGEERKIRCIHDGVWKNCDDGHTVNDFVRTILKEYDSIN